MESNTIANLGSLEVGDGGGCFGNSTACVPQPGGIRVSSGGITAENTVSNLGGAPMVDFNGDSIGNVDSIEVNNGGGCFENDGDCNPQSGGIRVGTGGIAAGNSNPTAGGEPYINFNGNAVGGIEFFTGINGNDAKIGITNNTIEMYENVDMKVNNLDMNGNRVDNRRGIFSSHLTTTQSNAENGLFVNIVENVDIKDGTYTANANDEVQVNTGGNYSISYTVNFHRTGSNDRNVMVSYIEAGATNLTDRARSACYIRNDGYGDECTNQDTTIVGLSSGDTVRVWTEEERGGQTGNDVEHASMEIEYLG
jgi:hypothetical protein